MPFLLRPQEKQDTNNPKKKTLTIHNFELLKKYMYFNKIKFIIKIYLNIKILYASQTYPFHFFQVKLGFKKMP